MNANKIINDVKEKVSSIDVKAIKEDLKSLDPGVLYTKAEDLVNEIDLKGKKQKVVDFMDSPKMDSIKENARVVKDFLGYVPNYVQSVPSMVKEALGIEKDEGFYKK